MRAFERAYIVNKWPETKPDVDPELCFVTITFILGNRYDVKTHKLALQASRVYWRRRIHFPYKVILEFLCKPEDISGIIKNGVTVVDSKNFDAPLFKRDWFKLSDNKGFKRKNAFMEISVNAATSNNVAYMRRLLGDD